MYVAVNKIQSPVIFAHNDLLLGNILYDPSSESKVTFIDYEYADFNFQAHDIGNHFDEFAGTFRFFYSHPPTFVDHFGSSKRCVTINDMIKLNKLNLMISFDLSSGFLSLSLTFYKWII